MEIVILDALTLGNELDLSVLDQFGKLTIYQTTSAKEVKERISNAKIVITNKVVLNEDNLSRAPFLKLICVAATGVNNIDLSAARRRNIVVTNVRDYSTESVAQHTFALILALENSLLEFVEETRSGNWSESPTFAMLNHPVYELKGKKLGIIGYGAIGKRVAELGAAFGMQVLIGKRPGVSYNDSERVDFYELLLQSDVLSIHAPLTENTRNLITINELQKMKSSSILINVARGGIVNEPDLYLALNQRLIRGAATDVLLKEPMDKENPLIGLKNLLITPHMAWSSLESRQSLLEGIVENINIFFSDRAHKINLAI